MPPSLACSSSTLSCAKQLCKATASSTSSRSFSTTPRTQQRTTRARRALYRWLATVGDNFRNPLPGSTNYLGAYNAQGKLKRVVEAEYKKANDKKMDKGNRDIPKDPSEALPPESARDRTPFPISRSFINQSVLSEEFRDEIWFRIMKQGKSVREVSVDMGVEMSRVGAVVRLKEVELEWKRIGKPLATPYAKAVMSMLPKTGFAEDAASERSLPERKLFSKPKRLMSDEERKKLRAANREQRAIEARGIEGRNFARHESINDLPVHSKTGQQIFHPTSESRQFTRADAAKVFDERLLPADDRIPHPEMVVRQRELVEGLSDEERMEKAQLRAAKAESKRLAEVAKQVAKDSKTKRVETPRWEFRFTEANVEDAGKTGRGHKGVGWRYGVPLYDRNKGLVKIPQSVE